MSSNSLMKNKKMVDQDDQDKTLPSIAPYSYWDILTLRPPPSDLERSVARPKRGDLPWGLPLSARKPLKDKMPVMKGPGGPVVFSRGKLGQKLWRGSRDTKFQLKDPYGHEVRFDYEASHDPHLKNYLRRPPHVKHLLDHKMITAHGDVKCTVEQYNMFRQFLYDQYSDALRKEAEYRERLATERLMIRKAQENAEIDAAKLKKFEDTKSKRISNLNRLENLQVARLENCKRRLQRVLDRSERAAKEKEADVLIRKQRAEAYNKKIRTRIENAQYVERTKKIKAMKGWHKQDVKKKKLFQQREMQRELENNRKAEERWKRKVEEQKKQIAKEEFLQDQRKRIKEINRENYMKNMEKAWSQLEDELNMRKCSNTLHRVKVDKREKSIKQIKQSITDAYALRRSTLALSQDRDALETIFERIQQTLNEIRYDLEPYIVIAHAKERLEKQENVPLPVSGAIKFLLEQSVVEYTAGKVGNTMKTFMKKVLSSIDEIKNPPATAGGKSLSMQTVSLATTSRKQSVSYAKVSRMSQVASRVEVIHFEKTQDELAVPIEELRSTRDRAPTPMPSITRLTEILFGEGETDEFVDEYPGEYPFLEQKMLNLVIAAVSNKIMKMVPTRVRAVVQSRSYDRISITSTENESLPESKPVARLCHMILCEEQITEHQLTSIVDRLILGLMQDLDLTPSYLRLKMKQNMEENL